MAVLDKLGFGPRREVVQGGGLYRIDVTPPSWVGGGKLPTQSVILSPDQYARYCRWRAGALIQEVLSDLMDTQREILMTGLGDEDFHRLVGEEDLSNLTDTQREVLMTGLGGEEEE